MRPSHENSPWGCMRLISRHIRFYAFHRIHYRVMLEMPVRYHATIPPSTLHLNLHLRAVTVVASLENCIELVQLYSVECYVYNLENILANMARELRVMLIWRIYFYMLATALVIGFVRSCYNVCLSRNWAGSCNHVKMKLVTWRRL